MTTSMIPIKFIRASSASASAGAYLDELTHMLARYSNETHCAMLKSESLDEKCHPFVQEMLSVDNLCAPFHRGLLVTIKYKDSFDGQFCKL
jgi:hypothetical protein